MKRYVCLTLTLAAIAGFAASPALARGGHGGGHGGGHHGGGHHAGHHASHHSQHHSHHGNHTHHYAHNGAHRPFTHGWYGNHGGAWGWGRGGYGWGNPWGAATFGTAAAWLGMSALDGDYGDYAEGSYPVENTTVYTSDNGGQVGDEQDSQADNTADSATDDSADENFQPALSSDEANQLAAGGANEAADAKFLPLGVYTFAPAGETEASSMLQLAVSKEGQVRGSFYDLKGDKDYKVQGAIDKKTGNVAWTIEGQNKAVCQTTLRELTEQSGPVTVHEGGKTSEWTIARAQENQTEAKTGTASEAQPSVEPATQK